MARSGVLRWRYINLMAAVSLAVGGGSTIPAIAHAATPLTVVTIQFDDGDADVFQWLGPINKSRIPRHFLRQQRHDRHGRPPDLGAAHRQRCGEGHRAGNRGNVRHALLLLAGPDSPALACPVAPLAQSGHVLHPDVAWLTRSKSVLARRPRGFTTPSRGG